MVMRKFVKDNYLKLPFGFEGRIWDLIVSVPDHCLSFYFLMICISLAIMAKCLIPSENIIQSSTDSFAEAIKFQLSSFEAHLSVDGCCCNFPENYIHMVMHT